MAANDELPRGLLLSSFAGGGQASVVFPAIAGIAWVLESAKVVFIFNAAGSSAGVGIFLQVITGTVTINLTRVSIASGLTQGTDTEDEVTPTNIMSAPGASLTVQGSAAVANFDQIVIARAYPA